MAQTHDDTARTHDRPTAPAIINMARTHDKTRRGRMTDPLQQQHRQGAHSHQNLLQRMELSAADKGMNCCSGWQNENTRNKVEQLIQQFSGTLQSLI
jgi:hypothetical protein